MNEIDVFVGNNCVISPEIYELWLKGYTAPEAARIQQNKVALKVYGANFEDLLSDIVDYYRIFTGLEEMLKTPPRLSHQLVYQFDPDTIHMLIQKYYSFDAPLIREIFGRKLNSRSRKDLDDLSEETDIPVRSCRRQFDNAKRVFKTVEELSGRLVDNIQTHFCLSEELAKAYAAIVFITNNRFETGKKKLSYLSFEDFAVCANYMISNWSYSSEECQNHEDMDVDMDRDFLLDLREFKVLMEREYAEEHRSLMIRTLQPVMREKVLTEMDANFRSVSKTIINIASGLNHSKESRDIFIDVLEKLIEPWQQLSWTKQDAMYFLNAFKETALQLDIFRSSPKLVKVWERYMMTFNPLVLQMYPK
ncbi:acidic fibroblast growth factor intracellular-binding protein-like [Physella acuta]|uniref:acidic fibroblast growth factor intracellular-binding protein-like n=1 Tax=Physella acuta TaxID=109671 RepID=UPI0027DBE9CE|nr:acidic fibroblast growth factor intracellular-binding protein-like [Physella acuta]XP_059173352.1 acidic fibroblast growth factor intracellular-binding protein-like [Physella acuta]